MATFGFLCPDTIPILGVNCLGKCNKGPNARILARNGTFVDVSMVRSVETVVQLLKTHLYLDVNTTSAEVLRLNYEGNIHLRNGNIGQAIDCYNLALQMGDKEQEVTRKTNNLSFTYIIFYSFFSPVSSNITMPGSAVSYERYGFTAAMLF